MSKRTAPSQAQTQSLVKIGAADIALARQRGPAALDYYRGLGLREVRSRATALALAGALPVLGWMFLGWSPASMLVFLIIDALFTILLDWLRLPLARAWMQASHRLDGEAGEVLGIVDGLEDGSGMRSARGGAHGPMVGMVVASAMTLFMLPVFAAAIEPIGMQSIGEVLAQPLFLWLLAADAGGRLLSSAIAIWQVRQHAPGSRLIFAESGNVAVLYAGLMFLCWLPLTFGQTGLLLLFAVVYLVRIAFAGFALWWMPRAVDTLARRLASDDFSVNRQLAKGLPD